MSASVLQIVISQWRSLGYTFADKGNSFEDGVMSLFREHGIASQSLTIRESGDIFQFDVLVLWEGYLFIFECKNYLLPADSPGEEFYFLEKIDEAIDQVLRLETAIKTHPELIEQHLGQSLSGLIAIPIVLNAMPFSLPDQRRGVYVYDYAALGKFCDGYLSVGQQLTVDGRQKRVEHIIYKFWERDSPAPGDLVRAMAEPIQLKSEMAQWHLQPMQLRVSEAFAIRFEALRRDEPSFEGLLKALGNDDRRIELIRATMAGLWDAQSS
jgi:hypothetical protein